jgi:hypothetical protein
VKLKIFWGRDKKSHQGWPLSQLPVHFTIHFLPAKEKGEHVPQQADWCDPAPAKRSKPAILTV